MLHSSSAVGGGWFGWLGYGFGARIEDLPPQPPRPHPGPTTTSPSTTTSGGWIPTAAWWFESLSGEGADPAAGLTRGPAPVAPRRHGAAAPGFDGHRWAVEDCVRRIAEGELFQANLTLRLEGTLDGDPLDAFADATRDLRPAPRRLLQAAAAPSSPSRPSCSSPQPATARALRPDQGHRARTRATSSKARRQGRSRARDDRRPRPQRPRPGRPLRHRPREPAGDRRTPRPLPHGLARRGDAPTRPTRPSSAPPSRPARSPARPRSRR